jgi:hypothetical protein
MARHEAHREDLLAEATALVERIELQIPDEIEPVVVGFRRGGEASIYFGQDLAWHFNAAGELRRAFRNDELLKADRGRLAGLTRRRTEAETQLVRRDLDAAETERHLADLGARLVRLRDALETGGAKVQRQVPEDADVRSRVAAWLANRQGRVAIARHPRVK